MALSFANIFNKKNDDFKIPDEVIDCLNNKLGGKLYYSKLDNSTLMLNSSEDIKVKICPILDDDFKKVLGNNYSFEDFFYLIYNSQRMVLIDNMSPLISNGEYKNISDLIFSCKFKKEKNKIYIMPNKFEEVDPLLLEYDNKKLYISIKRIPNLSLDEIKFHGTCGFFNIDLVFNKKTKLCNLKPNYDLTKCTSISQIVDCLKLYNSLNDGKCLIDGCKLIKNENYSMSKQDKNRIVFWTKVIEIEKKINLKFVPEFDISESRFKLIQELYYSLCLNRIIRKKSNINTLDFNKNPNYSIDKYNEMKGKVFCFSFQQEKNIEIFGCNIKVFLYNFLNHVKVKDFIEDGDKVHLVLEYDEKSIYAVKYFNDFTSLSQINDCISINEVDNSKYLNDYLDEENK